MRAVLYRSFPQNYVKNHDLMGEFWANMEKKDIIPTLFGVFR